MSAKKSKRKKSGNEMERFVRFSFPLRAKTEQVEFLMGNGISAPLGYVVLLLVVVLLLMMMITMTTTMMMLP